MSKNLRKLFKQEPTSLIMFKKKRCKNCGERISNDYDFCPYCGTRLRELFEEDSEEWGLLGKDDFSYEGIKLPTGLNTLFNSLLKNLNKQIDEFEDTKKQKKIKERKGGIGISIYTSGNKPPKIKVTSFGNIPKFKNKEKKIKEKIKKIKNLPQTSPKKFAGLSKKEPETNIRRLSNKIVYEIKMPEVKSIKDVSITQLESSIEIKALTTPKGRKKKYVYYKIIPVNLPIRKYNLLKEKLVLELETQE